MQSSDLGCSSSYCVAAARSRGAERPQLAPPSPSPGPEGACRGCWNPACAVSSSWPGQGAGPPSPGPAGSPRRVRSVSPPHPHLGVPTCNTPCSWRASAQAQVPPTAFGPDQPKPHATVARRSQGRGQWLLLWQWPSLLGTPSTEGPSLSRVRPWVPTVPSGGHSAPGLPCAAGPSLSPAASSPPSVLGPGRWAECWAARHHPPGPSLRPPEGPSQPRL